MHVSCTRLDRQACTIPQSIEFSWAGHLVAVIMSRRDRVAAFGIREQDLGVGWPLDGSHPTDWKWKAQRSTLQHAPIKNTQAIRRLTVRTLRAMKYCVCNAILSRSIQKTSERRCSREQDKILHLERVVNKLVYSDTKNS